MKRQQNMASAGGAHMLLAQFIHWLLVLSMQPVYARQAKDSRVQINILHVNDVHNRFEPATASTTWCERAADDSGKCFGGYARIATAVKEAREEDPQTLFLNAGDEFLGTIWDVVYNGNMTSYFQNMLGTDAMVIGNHEFDFGSKFLGEHIRRLNFPMLGACNTDLTNSTHLTGALQSYIIKKVKGKKVAILGVTTPDINIVSNADDGERFFDPVVGLTNCLRTLWRTYGESIDAVVVLSHAGYQEDLRIADQVPGIHLVIGGHTHTLLWTGPTPPKNASNPASNDTLVEGPYPTYVTPQYDLTRRVPVVTAYWASRYMGRLVMEVGGGKPVTVTGTPMLLGGSQAGDNNVPRDPQVDAAIQDPAVDGPVLAYATEPVGYSQVLLDNTYARRNESNLGDLVCDAMMDWFRNHNNKLDSSSTICLVNGGMLRSTVPPGNVTVGVVGTALPFGDLLVVVNVTGESLITALANGVSAVGATSGTGRFPQVSGLRLVVNTNRTAPSPVDSAAAMDRLVQVKLLLPDGSETDIDPCASYSLITNDYIGILGNDNYVTVGASPKLLPSGAPITELVTAYITETSPITQGLDGRVINCDFANHPACTEPEKFATTCN